ncbi:MAG: WYL domain-containing protein [Bacteroidetes bacterium]|nr:WYL domain-containing protein [Bacteroidota bacterium]
MEATRTERILRLLVMLSGTRWYSMAELEHRFYMSARNLRRDLDLIEACGFVLERENGYRLQATHTANRNLKNLLHFSEEEVSILYQTLARIEGDSPVKERLVRKMNAFYDLRALEQLRERDDLTKVRIIRQSMAAKKQVKLIAYRSSNSNSIDNRIVEVFDFLPDYRAAWCYDLGDHTCKQFKLSRMQSVELLQAGWRFEARHQKPFTDVFRLSAPKALATVELRLSLKAYNLLLEEYPLAADYVKKDKEQYLLKTQVAAYYGVGRFVLGLLRDVEIIKPAGFKKYIKSQIENYLK